MQVTLNIIDRFNIINTIGESLSSRFSLARLNDLLSVVALSRDEATDPNLSLRYVQETGSFEYNTEYDKVITVDIDEDLLEVLGLNV